MIACGSPLYGQTAEQQPVNEDLIPLNQTESTANTGTAADSIPQPKLTISIWDYVRMVLVLALVVGVIYLIFFLLKKGARKKLPQNDVIKILSSYSLQGNNLLYLVEAGTNIFFISAGDGKVNLISEIKDKESIDTIRLETARQNIEKKQSFSETLLKMFKTANNASSGQIDREKNREIKSGADTIAKSENDSGENPIDFIKRQRSRLENLR